MFTLRSSCSGGGSRRVTLNSSSSAGWGGSSEGNSGVGGDRGETLSFSSGALFVPRSRRRMIDYVVISAPFARAAYMVLLLLMFILTITY